MTNTTAIILETYPDHAGKTSALTVGDKLVTVQRVAYGNQADIEFRKYTQDYKRQNGRPFILIKSRRQFKTLENAVKALLAERSQ